MSQYEQLWSDTKSYLKTRYDLLRLELLDKLSLILGILLLVIVALFLLLTAFAYFSIAVVMLLAKCMPISVACCIIGVFFLIVLLVVYLLRERLFINPFIKILSGIIYSQEKENQQINEKGATDETTV